VGVNRKGQMFVLDIDRFKTNKISFMFDRVLTAYRKWGFRKLRAETTVAQALIVTQFKDYMRQNNCSFSIDEHRPTKNKEERMRTALEPRYANSAIWHYKGGNCQTLEEELIMEHPEHDDIKDCLASVLEIATAPVKRNSTANTAAPVYNNRFGGVAYA